MLTLFLLLLLMLLLLMLHMQLVLLACSLVRDVNNLALELSASSTREESRGSDGGQHIIHEWLAAAFIP